MSTITNGSMKLIKSDITDIIHSTIGSDLPNNFDKIDKTVDEVNTRINNILTTPVDGVSAQEIIDARGDSPTLGTRLNNMQTQTDTLQEEVDSLSTTGIPKLVSFDYDIAATTDNQTVFTIPYEHLSLASDTVEVFVNGIAVPDNYYIVTEPVEIESEITLGFVTLTEPKPTGTIVKVRILKNVPNGDEGSVDGDIITVDSMPVNRINSGELNDFMNDSLSEINASLNDMMQDLNYNCEYGITESIAIADSSYVTIPWNNKIRDTKNMLDRDNNTKIIIPKDGVYNINCDIQIVANSSIMTKRTLLFKVNNITKSFNFVETLNSAILKINCNIHLKTNDILHFEAFQNSGISGILFNDEFCPKLTIQKVGD